VFSGTAPAESAGIAERVEGYARKDGRLDYLVELLEEVGRQRTDQTSCRLPPHPTSAGEARQFTREVLDQWSVPDLIDDAVLVVSELVANAVVHARSACELRISVDPLALRVEVVDESGGMPDPLPPSSTRNSGRGLHLIDALAAAWGVQPEADGGKIVWAELRRPS
jgi:anti-sigma regulatory factor (Ser/Thr protein kinase)